MLGWYVLGGVLGFLICFIAAQGASGDRASGWWGILGPVGVVVAGLRGVQERLDDVARELLRAQPSTDEFLRKDPPRGDPLRSPPTSPTPEEDRPINMRKCKRCVASVYLRTRELDVPIRCAKCGHEQTFSR